MVRSLEVREFLAQKCSSPNNSLTSMKFKLMDPLNDLNHIVVIRSYACLGYLAGITSLNMFD